MLAWALLLATCWGPSVVGAEVDPAAATVATSADAPDVLHLGAEPVPALAAVRASRHGELLLLEGTVQSPADRELAERLARANGGATEVLNRIEIGTASFAGVMPALRGSVQKLQHLLGMLPMLLVAVLVGWVVWRTGRWLSTRGWIARLTRNPFAGEIVKQAIRLAGAVLGLLVALELLGATALAAAVLGSAGIAGIALGFAFRDLLENYIAGVLLSVRQPFAPDDVILLEGREGVVVAMNSRATILMTHDGNHLTFPNAIVFKAVILNLTRNGNRRFDFLVDLNPEIDLAAALRVGLDAVSSAPGVLAEPKPFVQLNQLGRDVVQLQFFAWVDQRRANFGLARSEALRRARLQLERIGAYFGPPQLRLVTTQAAPSPQRAVTAPPEVAEAHDERQAVDEAIEKTRSEMGSSDLLRSDARE